MVNTVNVELKASATAAPLPSPFQNSLKAAAQYYLLKLLNNNKDNITHKNTYATEGKAQILSHLYTYEGH